MRRPLPVIASAYLVGLILGEAGRFFPITVAALWVLFLPFLLLKRDDRRSLFLLWGVVALGACANQLSRVTAMTVPEEKVMLTGRVHGPMRHEPRRETMLLEDARMKTTDSTGTEPIRLPGAVRLSVTKFSPGFRHGDRIQLTGRLRTPTGFRNPGGFDDERYRLREGMVASVSVHRPEDIRWLGEEPSFLGEIYDRRERIRLAMAGSLTPETSAVLQAMILGETGGLTPELRDRFMASGATHLLSISGSHLGLVAFGGFYLTRWGVKRLPYSCLAHLTLRWTPSQLAAAVTVAPVVFYTLLSGGQTATVRSLVMVLVYLAAVMIHRRDDSLTALALAALLVTLWSPQSIGDISFVLSYTAVLCMILFDRSGRFVPARSRLIANLMRFFGLSLAASLGTLPLVAYYFNQVSWVGWFSNPLVIPWVGWAVVPLGLVGSVLTLWIGNGEFVLERLNEWGVGLLLWLVDGFGSWPGAEWHVASPSVGAMLAYDAVLFAALSGAVATRLRTVMAGGFLLLLMVCWMFGADLSSRSGELRVTLLDVGSGESALIRFPDGRTALIDGGGRYEDFSVGRAVVAPYLWDEGIERLDVVVATRSHRDHMGGLVYLLERFDVGEVWTGGPSRGTKFYREFDQVIRDRNLPVRTIGAQEQHRRFGPCEMAAVHSWTVAIQVECGRHRAVFLGDTPARFLTSASLLKVPHRKWGTPHAVEIIERVRPNVVVLTGRGPAGGPDFNDEAASDTAGRRIFATDRDGAITVRFSDRGVQAISYTETSLVPVGEGDSPLQTEWHNLKTVWRREV
jgi:competence protein ComEC